MNKYAFILTSLSTSTLSLFSDLVESLELNRLAELVESLELNRLDAAYHFFAFLRIELSVTFAAGFLSSTAVAETEAVAPSEVSKSDMMYFLVSSRELFSSELFLFSSSKAVLTAEVISTLSFLVLVLVFLAFFSSGLQPPMDF